MGASPHTNSRVGSGLLGPALEMRASRGAAESGKFFPLPSYSSPASKKQQQEPKKRHRRDRVSISGGKGAAGAVVLGRAAVDAKVAATVAAAANVIEETEGNEDGSGKGLPLSALERAKPVSPLRRATSLNPMEMRSLLDRRKKR